LHFWLSPKSASTLPFASTCHRQRYQISSQRKFHPAFENILLFLTRSRWEQSFAALSFARTCSAVAAHQAGVRNARMFGFIYGFTQDTRPRAGFCRAVAYFATILSPPPVTYPRPPRLLSKFFRIFQTHMLQCFVQLPRPQHPSITMFNTRSVAQFYLEAIMTLRNLGCCWIT
jgi:hypothetical protein